MKANHLTDDDALELTVFTQMKKKKKTLAVAESCTGGVISHRLTNIPGSSGYFTGGVIAYSNNIKTSMLEVPSDIIKKYGAVSRDVALFMASGVRDAFGADIGVSVTGIAGPGGGNPGKPVGTAYIGFASKKGSAVRKVFFNGDRVYVKNRFADSVMEFLLEKI